MDLFQHIETIRAASREQVRLVATDRENLPARAAASRAAMASVDAAVAELGATDLAILIESLAFTSAIGEVA